MNNDKYILIDVFARNHEIDDIDYLKSLLNDYKEYIRTSADNIYIKTSFIDIYKSFERKEETKAKSVLSETDRLFNIIDDLNKQIETKDKIIIELQNKLLQFTETAQEIANKSLQLQEQRNLIEAHEKVNKSWFKRLLKRKSIDN